MAQRANTIVTEMTAENTNFRKFGMKDKIGYLLGDFGNNFFFILVASFLMVYYTNVFHINPSAVGGLFLFARLWDAVAGGIGGAAIAAVGYNPNLQAQAQSTLDGIHTLGTLIPAIVFAVIFLMILFLYPLNKQRTEQLAIDLAEKREGNN